MKPFEERKAHFFNRAKEIHGDKYSYEKSEYISGAKKILVVCNAGLGHPDFLVTAGHHINGPTGCPKCARNSTYTTEDAN